MKKRRTIKMWLAGATALLLLASAVMLASCGTSSTSTSATAASGSGTSVSQTSGGTQGSSGSQGASDTQASSDAAAAGTQGSPPAAPPDGSGGGPGGGSSSASVTYNAVYTVDGQTVSKSGEEYSAADADESAVRVTNSGVLTLSGASIATSGNTSSQDNSSFYGLNAGVLADNGGQITLSDSSIATTGTGANGAFATGSGSLVSLSNVTIKATADGAHGVMATQGGAVTLTNVNMDTTGQSSAAVATDRGGGTITVTGGAMKTSGMNSPGIYSTGEITANGGTYTATGSEAAVIEGGNSITLTDATLSGAKKWGVMIYQSMSGDAEGTKGTFTMTGGALSAETGPLFFVTNSTGIITLKGVQLTASSGVLLEAAAADWGNSGSNGGTAILTADAQTLAGDVVADNISSVEIALQNGSTLNGSINPDDAAKSVTVTLDSSSTWNVTADSHVTSLSGAVISGTSISNITGNGHTVYYDASGAANSALNGQTYSLAGGGQLAPK